MSKLWKNLLTGLTAMMLLLGLASVSATLTGCEDKGPMEEAGEQMDEAAEEAADEAEDIGDQLRDAAENMNN